MTILPLIITVAITPADSAMWQMSAPAYDNPAIKQWAMPSSHSRLGVGLHSSLLDRAADPREGRGEHYWTFQAETYLKYKSSTLWGDASYRNGKQKDIVWNETSDTKLLYPYLMADSVGGDMRMEVYEFGGGYADHSGRWAWGAALHYKAGLYYRNVDPRPRNTTGCLDLSAGAAYNVFADYYAGISASYRKYKQTNEIMFKNPMGVEKIYHTTGLGTHYGRFAGVGDKAFYSGNRWGATANLFPSSGKGLTATVNLSRFSFSKVLTDLNKLPLAHAWHNEILAQAGWLAPGRAHDWAVTARWGASRRHGTENIFGDASSNIYPQIFELELYADNAWHGRLEGLWQWHNPRGALMWVRPFAAFSHRSTIYAEPQREIRLRNWSYGLSALASMPFGAWRAGVNGALEMRNPTGCRLDFSDGGTGTPAGLIAVERTRYEYLAHSSLATALGISCARAINSRFALQIEGSWHHSSYSYLSNRGNTYDVAVSLLF